MQRFEFDNVLVALNAADRHRMSFAESVLPAAAGRQMGVVGMKVTAQGALLRGGFSMPDVMGYTLSLAGVSTVVIGCQTPDEVEQNAEIARRFQPLSPRSAVRPGSPNA